jgi:glutathionyl-hydroquinone reductase
MDRLESILAKQSFLIGNSFTETDIRAFTTAVRFGTKRSYSISNRLDPVYATHFKCNLRTIGQSYPNILKWMRSIYGMDGVAETVNMNHIKKHYFRSHIKINPNQIVGLNNGPKLA